MKKCPRCSLNHNKKGLYCSRSCANARTHSEERKKHISEKIKQLWENDRQRYTSIWTEEKRKQQSDIMKNVVELNPNSYSKENVSGRVKMYKVNSSHGLTKVKGTWELKVANYLNENNIKWTNDIEPFKYFWNGSWHFYFPDFYLEDKNIFIEVKGYKTARDIAKWSAVDNLIVIDKDKIKDLNINLSV